ncbi:hypothetical protein ACLK1S_22885 [Escherichia coli]
MPTLRTGDVTIDFVREALRDLLALRENWSPSTIFRRRWRSTQDQSRGIFLSKRRSARWRVRARWRWRWRKS